MKKTATLLILFAAVALFAEVPNGYNEAYGKLA